MIVCNALPEPNSATTFSGTGLRDWTPVTLCQLCDYFMQRALVRGVIDAAKASKGMSKTEKAPPNGMLFYQYSCLTMAFPVGQDGIASIAKARTVPRIRDSYTAAVACKKKNNKHKNRAKGVQRMKTSASLSCMPGLCSPIEDALPVGEEEGEEAGGEAGMEAGSEARVEAGVEARGEAGVEAGSEAGMEGGMKAGVEAGMEAAGGHRSSQGGRRGGSLIWWVLWYTGTITVASDELEKSTLDNLAHWARKLSKRLSKNSVKTLEVGEKCIGDGKDLLKGTLPVHVPTRLTWRSPGVTGYDNDAFDRSFDMSANEKTVELAILKNSEMLLNAGVNGKPERLL
ncbi:hypothetical protein P4O66_001435 [Electrophorus voltai]|uniref:Uncharacterized protein n=1 Tax=Electrophorus voltai TaxID=2609070 RepID=A0AAD8Z7B9_9TELE|nr:hypothetical protein P4O66_001435 [Electrophorus voltai]